MLQNHLKPIFRSLLRTKSYTLLNLLGLSSGLIVFILITLYTTYEFSFDSYHENVDRIYRIYKADADNSYQGSNKYAVTPAPLAAALMDEFPEVQHATRIDSYGNVLVTIGDEVYMEPEVHISDPQTFKIFSFQAVSGYLTNFLQEKNTVALSESMAMKYFGRTDILDEVVYFRNEYPMKVSGVFKDMPKNSHFVLNVVFHFESVMLINEQALDRWNNNSYHTFLLMAPGAEAAVLQAKLPELRAKYVDDPIDEDGQETVYTMQPMTDVHFTQGVNFDIAPNSDPQSLYIYFGIALMVLIIAGINYVNLATSRAVNRLREIGIRKVVGAHSGSLVWQFLLESLIVVLMAMVLAIICLVMITPLFANFVDRPLFLDLTEPKSLIFLISLSLGLSILAGLYPSLILSSFRPADALKGHGRISQSSGSFFRNALVVFQFTVSSGLIISAAILSEQLSYIRNVDTGYTREQIIILYIRDKSIRDHIVVFKEELKKIPGVSAVAAASSLPNNISSRTMAKWPGKDKEMRIPIYTGSVDYDFFKLFELEFKEGSAFDRERVTDKKGVVLNEAAVKAFGWEDPIGRQYITQSRDTGRVVGVLKDFNQHSLHLGISPLQLFFRENQRRVSIRLMGDHIPETIKAIEQMYNLYDPAYPFEYNYFEDIFDRAYLSEIKTATLAQWFTALTILIACLGLYGLAANKVQLRIKEVGVRKVLGASVTTILTLLSKDFVKLLLLAFVIASPVTYYIMNNWLNGFAFHISISFSSMIMTFGIMILVAGITVGYRTYRAAVRNPVEALREE